MLFRSWVCDGLVEWGKAQGVTVTTILNDPASPDFTSLIQQAMSNKPDAVILMEPAGLAVPFLKAAQDQARQEEEAANSASANDTGSKAPLMPPVDPGAGE